MGYDFEKTHSSILDSACRHFMESGFRNASIRSICEDAGVTNGAFYAHFKSKEDLFAQLVEPSLKELYEIYGEENRHFENIQSADDILRAFESTFASDQIIIHFIYSRKNAFLLLLKAAGGTVYENFPAMLTDRERQETEAFFQECRPFVQNPENFSSGIISKASFLVVSTIFDCFLAGKAEEETVRETQLISEFCLAGLRKIWGI